MDPIPRKTESEASIQRRLISKLRIEGWFSKATHGNEFQIGFPDVFACHIRYGSRWIELKKPGVGILQDTQHHFFLELAKRNIGVWILTDSTDWEYKKLFSPANWHTYCSIMKSNRGSKALKPFREPRKQADGPERRIQEAVKAELAKDGWFVADTNGNIYQYGFPDLYACHARYGSRWIEIKNPKGYVFTPAQIETFPQFSAQGVGVWVLTGPEEIPKIFSPANWYTYLK